MMVLFHWMGMVDHLAVEFTAVVCGPALLGFTLLPCFALFCYDMHAEFLLRSTGMIIIMNWVAKIGFISNWDHNTYNMLRHVWC